MAKEGVPVPVPDDDLRTAIEGVRNALTGKINATEEVTLTASAASTVVTDDRVSGQSTILFMPRTANAAAEQAAGTMYVSARSAGSFTITHANNAQTDRDFDYLAIG